MNLKHTSNIHLNQICLKVVSVHPKLSVTIKETSNIPVSFSKVCSGFCEICSKELSPKFQQELRSEDPGTVLSKNNVELTTDNVC